MDAFSRYLWVHPLRDKCAVTIAEKIMYDQLATYGVPHQIYTDLGKEFNCRILSEITHATAVEHRFALVSTPHTNNVERAHRTLMEIVRSLTCRKGEDARRWEQLVKLAAAEMNASVHMATGYRPDEVQFG